MHIDADFAASLSVKGDSLKGSTELERLATRLHLIEVVLLKLFQRVDLCLECSMLLGLVSVSKGTCGPFDKHVIWYLRLGLEFVLCKLKHLVVSLRQGTLRRRRSTLILDRGAPEVLLVGLVVELLGLQDLSLLLALGWP